MNDDTEENVMLLERGDDNSRDPDSRNLHNITLPESEDGKKDPNKENIQNITIPENGNGKKDPDSENLKDEEKPGSKTIFSEGRAFPVLCLLSFELFERLTYYGFMAGLVLYCTSNLGMDQVEASNVNLIFQGCVYFVPIFGGYLADDRYGRFWTIFGSCVIYLVGCVLLPATAVDYTQWGWSVMSLSTRIALFMVGLVCIALGTGGLKANIGPFGAEQVEAMGNDAVRSFFIWFYWVINVGAMISHTAVAYIQQEISFAWGFFVPLLTMTLSTVLLCVAKVKYHETEPKGSVLSIAFGIIKEGCNKRSPESDVQPPATERKIFFKAKQTYGGSYEDHLVDGLYSVIKVTPFCVLVIIYWAMYAQMSNTFFAQGERMDIRMGGWNLPAAAIQAFNTLSIIILIPVVDRLVYPCFSTLGIKLTYLRRMGFGMLIAATAVFVAGIVEIKRKAELEKPGGSHIQVLAGENFTASSLNIFVQVPQFTLIGASEIFTSITTLEFAYNQAPVSMQGILNGLFLATVGLGNWFSSALLTVVDKATRDDPWWSPEINNAKMENLMFLLGALMLANFLVFCVVAHFYEYQDPSTFEKKDKVPDREDGIHSDTPKDSGFPNEADEAMALESADLP